jgi:hypothetical protein
MAASVKTRGGAAKTAAAKKTTTKKATVAKASASARKVPGKKAPAKKAAKATPRTILFEGKEAKNRHFEISRANFDGALDRATEEGVALSEVVRAGLALYASKTPAAAKRAAGAKLTMPASGLKSIKALFKEGNSPRISAYLAALASAGWPLQTIADAIVDSGAATKMTRQAVSLRIIKANAPDAPKFSDLPSVPPIGLRRPYPAVSTGGGTAAMSRTKAGRIRTDLKDYTIRIADEDYEKALVRARFEGAKVTAVIDNWLGDYAAGKVHLPKKRRAKVAATA